MTQTAPNHFILEAFDTDLWCPVLQTRFTVDDLAGLQKALGEKANDDPELQYVYTLDRTDVANLTATFNIRFDPAPLTVTNPKITLHRLHSISRFPYLVHTGYELPLLLDGRKKLAKMYEPYPPMTFNGEERFDHWVAAEILHRVEKLEPFDKATKKWKGTRYVYYTLKGEEWRIPAMELIWKAASKSGGWNEYFERLEGMLFGYEDWQNDWWIENGRRRARFGGTPLCCPVTASGLDWLEAAGFRALPPCTAPELEVALYDADNQAETQAFLDQNPESVALVCFSIPLARATDLLPTTAEHAGPWRVPSHRIGDLNRLLKSAVTTILTRP